MAMFYPDAVGTVAAYPRVTHVTVARWPAAGQTQSVMCRQYGDSKAEFVAHAQKTATLFFIVVMIWAATGFGAFWPAWVLLFAGLKLGNHARRVYGGGSEAAADNAEPVDTYA